MQEVCKYQRIIRDGEVVQPGDIDTVQKFEQLTAGLTLQGKTLLDVGCNCGEMVQLAAERGADAAGIDKNREFIHQARQLNPGLRFSVRTADRATGQWDIVLASALFHYITDYRAFFRRMAQIERETLVMDVWLARGEEVALKWIGRNRFVPTSAGFFTMAAPWFDSIENLGPALSPDSSERWVFRLSDPNPEPINAEIVYGPGGAGKTTYALELVDYEMLQLDSLFHRWYRAKRMSSFLSVAAFVNGVHKRNNPAEILEYHEFHRTYIRKWLERRRGFNVVIEGYDMCWESYRRMVMDILQELGWSKISTREMQAR